MPTLADAIKKNLKPLRKAKGFRTQEELSAASGVARTIWFTQAVLLELFPQGLDLAVPKPDQPSGGKRG